MKAKTFIKFELFFFLQMVAVETALQIFIVILLCKSIKVIGEMYKLMIGKLFRKNYLEI